MRVSLLLGDVAGAVSPCWSFANYKSRENTLHEGHRTGCSPSSKSPAGAWWPGGLLPLPCLIPSAQGQRLPSHFKEQASFPFAAC